MSVEVLVGDGDAARLVPHRLRAAFVPITVFSIWWTVRSIHRHHVAGED
jgi:uncharacterized membrane-anchored protein